MNQQVATRNAYVTGSMCIWRKIISFIGECCSNLLLYCQLCCLLDRRSISNASKPSWTMLLHSVAACCTSLLVGLKCELQYSSTTRKKVPWKMPNSWYCVSQPHTVVLIYISNSLAINFETIATSYVHGILSKDTEYDSLIRTSTPRKSSILTPWIITASCDFDKTRTRHV